MLCLTKGMWRLQEAKGARRGLLSRVTSRDAGTWLETVCLRCQHRLASLPDLPEHLCPALPVPGSPRQPAAHRAPASFLLSHGKSSTRREFWGRKLPEEQSPRSGVEDWSIPLGNGPGWWQQERTGALPNLTKLPNKPSFPLPTTTPQAPAGCSPFSRNATGSMENSCHR